LFHTDGQTDTTKLTVAFHNYANALKTRVPAESYRKTGNIVNLFVV
jgi:hypothetical protein